MQLEFFAMENILFFDFLCISNASKYRKGLLYSKEIFEEIRAFVSERYGIGCTVVFEIAHEPNDNGVFVRDEKTINYFKKVGFREILYDYVYPGLQESDIIKTYPAVLMTGGADARGQISEPSLRTILRMLYYKHYSWWAQPWLSPPQNDVRERFIDELYFSRIKLFADMTKFDTTGYRETQSLRVKFRNCLLSVQNSVVTLLGMRFIRAYSQLVWAAALVIVLHFVIPSDLAFLLTVIVILAVMAVLGNPGRASEIAGMLADLLISLVTRKPPRSSKPRSPRTKDEGWEVEEKKGKSRGRRSKR